jgi:hypothetical protein
MKKNEKIRLSIGLVVFVLILLLFSQCSAPGSVFKSQKNKSLHQSNVQKKDSTSVKSVSKSINDSFKVFVPQISSDFNFEYKKALPKDQDSITPEKLAEIHSLYSKKYSKLLSKELDRILNTINTNKKSGENSYSVKWNESTRTIDVDVTIGETEDLKVETSNSKESQITLIEQVKTEWTKVKIPWWVYALGIFFFRKNILSILSFLIPGLGQVKNVRDLIPRNRND